MVALTLWAPKVLDVKELYTKNMTYTTSNMPMVIASVSSNSSCGYYSREVILFRSERALVGLYTIRGQLLFDRGVQMKLPVWSYQCSANLSTGAAIKSGIYSHRITTRKSTV